MSGPSKPPPNEYTEAMRAYHLAAAEWLGLDPANVFRIKVDRGRPPNFRDPGRLVEVEVEWKATEQLTPRVGRVAARVVKWDGDATTFRGSVVLDYEDGNALLASLGPEPSPPWEADPAFERLRAMYPGSD